MSMHLTRAALAVGLLAGVALAADQLVPAKLVLVKDPSTVDKRKVVYKVKENSSGATIPSVDPATNGGATLHVVLTGGTGSEQCFVMPADGWTPISTIGFKYKDKDLVNGPVKVASIKKTPSGTFLIKTIMKGSGATAIDLVPGNQTTDYATNFTTGTDSYCSGTGTVPATPNPNDDKTFKVVNDTAPGSCGTTPCASPSGAFVD